MTGKGIVLLVEDNQKILDLNCRMLENEGLIVLTAKNIAEARERIKIAIPDVVVLDIMLPDGSGLDFLVELRRICDTPIKSVCVLFLTAKAERDDILTGLSVGGNDYITKPYDIEELRMRVLSFLRLAETAKMAKKIDTRELPIASILTEKELAVAVLVSRGMGNKEIGKKIYLSESRIKSSLSDIYKKFGIADKENKRGLLIKILKG